MLKYTTKEESVSLMADPPPRTSPEYVPWSTNLLKLAQTILDRTIHSIAESEKQHMEVKEINR